MKMHTINFAVACGIALSVVWIICVLFVMLMPMAMMELSGSMMHMEVTNMQWSMSLKGLIVGVIAWALVGGFTGGLIATFYNRLQSDQEV